MGSLSTPTHQLSLTQLHGWRFLCCGCTVCYQGSPHRFSLYFSVKERCLQAEELADARMEQTLADLNPFRAPRSHTDRRASFAARRDLYVRTMLHYGPDPVIDPEGFQQWKTAAEQQIPPYGYTPGGRAIGSKDDPDFDRAACACGFAWAAAHSPGDGTGCPEHLQPRHIRHPNLDTPADLEFRARYERWVTEVAERRAQRARSAFRLV
ncbi:hypothetical protein GCM10009733_020710 [Nonomuraea maheshkhaliensis]|uniref:Uncharacterized protein n=2 Tax=Nonomuraea maheshkhaliensis TaxID=419590 RepID=A0ABN2EZI9_9ACTN